MISLAGGNVTGPFTFTSWISSISSSLLLVLIVPIARPQKNQFHFVSNKKFEFFTSGKKLKKTHTIYHYTNSACSWFLLKLTQLSICTSKSWSKHLINCPPATSFDLLHDCTSDQLLFSNCQQSCNSHESN